MFVPPALPVCARISWPVLVPGVVVVMPVPAGPLRSRMLGLVPGVVVVMPVPQDLRSRMLGLAPEWS